jgi:hypothetical protein
VFSYGLKLRLKLKGVQIMAEVDIATLGIKVDTSGADKAEDQLDKLAKTADRTEDATKGVTTATGQMDATIRAAIAAINSNTQAMSGLTANYNKNKTAGHGAAAAADDMDARLAKLRGTIDPMAVAIDKVNQELIEARALFEAGAMSAEDYARAQTVLNARSADFALRQSKMNDAMGLGARSAKLQSHEMLNLSRQFADIGVTAAMGMSPMMILVQQGPQIADVFASARTRGIGFGQAMKQVGGLIAPFAPMLLGIGAAAAVAFGGAALVTRNMGKELGDVQAEFGLTAKEMKQLEKDGVSMGYTFGDVFGGIGRAIKEEFSDTFAEEIEAVSKWWNTMLDDITANAEKNIGEIIGLFIGAYKAVKATWSMLPAAMGDFAIQATNATIDALERMINAAIGGMNSLLDAAPDWMGLKGDIATKKFQRYDNPNAGAFNNTVDVGSKAFMEGMNEGKGAVSRIGQGIRDQRKDRIQGAIDEMRDGNGGSKKAPKPKASAEEKDWEKALEHAKEYIAALNEAREEIGKNQFEIKRLNTEREIGDLKAAAAATGSAAAMKMAEDVAKDLTKATEEWINATNAQVIKEFRLELEKEADALKFETSLVGLSNEQHARATKEREIHLRIMELEEQGHYDIAEAIAAERGQLIDLAGARGRSQDAMEQAGRMASAHREVADAVRDATSSFGEMFGTVGEGYSNLINTIYDFTATQAEAQERLTVLQEQYNQGAIDQAQYEFEKGQIQRQMGRDQIAVYGDMLGAAKTFFKEGSTGFKVMETAERAYRMFQFAMQIKAMFMDKAETASSVANSGARAAADGVAAVAKAIASLPFPLNIAAGAATAAFLIAMGVKMAKGGGGAAKGASQAASKAADIYSGPVDAYGNPTSGYSVLRPGATTVAGDPSQARWPSGGAPAANNNGMTFKGGDLIINGGADRRTAEEMQQQFQQWSRRTVQDARQAAAADRAAASQRQSIGA